MNKKSLAVVIFVAYSTYAQNYELETINVRANDTKTEGTNSYTTTAMQSATGITLAPRNTPQSVSVITQKQFQDHGLTSFDDALKTTTGINVTRHGSRSVYQARGFFIEHLNEDGISSTIGAPGITGNPFRDPKQQLDLALYDHIEVVRGATGLMQVNSEPGGSINAIRKKPTDETQKNIDVLADRFGKIRVTGDASGTISKELDTRGRLVIVGEKDKTFKDKIEGQNHLIYGVGDQKIGENLLLTIGAIFQNQHDTPDPYGLPLTDDGHDLKLPRKTALIPDWNQGKYRKRNSFVEVDYEINNNWNWNNKFDYKRTNSNQSFAALAGGGRLGGGAKNNVLPLDEISYYQHSGKNFAFRSNLIGQFEAFNQIHDASIIYRYNRENTDIVGLDQNTNDAKFNIFNWKGNEIPRPDWNNAASRNTSKNNFFTHTLSAAAHLRPSDNFHIVTGANYSHWKRHYEWDYQIRNHQPDTRTDNNFTHVKARISPYFGVIYDFDTQSSFYVNYNNIFKYTANIGKDGNLLPAALGHNYELGWKGEFFDGELNAQLSYFIIDQKNVAINSRQRMTDGSNRFYFEPMTLRSRGIDAEISGKLSNYWQIFAGYTFNTRKYTETIGSIVKGSSFNKQSPKHMLRVATNFRLPNIENWSIGGGFSSQSSTSSGWDVANGGHTVWNANIHYMPSNNFRLGVIINNLTDKRYYENHGIRAHGWGSFYGEPRNVMLNFNWNIN